MKSQKLSLRCEEDEEKLYHLLDYSCINENVGYQETPLFSEELVSPPARALSGC